MRKSLLALAAGSFGIGTTEFVIMGLLPDLARDFRVSIPTAGTLVSIYALSVTFGSPVFAILMGKMDRRKALLLLMGMFLAGNIGCALAPTFGLMMAARIITALCHGTFYGIGSIVATNLVPRSERAQAVSIMFSGLTFANVMGVPAGTALGQALGWRSVFWALIPIGIAAAAGLWSFIPSQIPEPTHVKDEFRTLAKPEVLMVFALSIISSVSLFSVFTYIAPTLEQVTGLSPSVVALVLVLFGVGITIGNLVGGRLSDWKQMPSFLGGALVVAMLLCIMPSTQPHKWAAILMVFLWGIASFATGSPLQSRIVDQAKDAPLLASTMNQGAYNLGNALGASIGGLALTMGLGYAQLGYVGSAAALVLFLVGFIEYKREQRVGLA